MEDGVESTTTDIPSQLRFDRAHKRASREVEWSMLPEPSTIGEVDTRTHGSTQSASRPRSLTFTLRMRSLLLLLLTLLEIPYHTGGAPHVLIDRWSRDSCVVGGWTIPLTGAGVRAWKCLSLPPESATAQLAVSVENAHGP